MIHNSVLIALNFSLFRATNLLENLLDFHMGGQLQLQTRKCSMSSSTVAQEERRLPEQLWTWRPKSRTSNDFSTGSYINVHQHQLFCSSTVGHFFPKAVKVSSTPALSSMFARKLLGPGCWRKLKKL
uniref:Uncharacterized protein n=1 Tax=Arundo donax TaxID=35708 RepID=A0A0A9HEY6_ARUDO